MICRPCRRRAENRRLGPGGSRGRAWQAQRRGRYVPIRKPGRDEHNPVPVMVNSRIQGYRAESARPRVGVSAPWHRAGRGTPGRGTLDCPGRARGRPGRVGFPHQRSRHQRRRRGGTRLSQYCIRVDKPRRSPLHVTPVISNWSPGRDRRCGDARARICLRHLRRFQDNKFFTGVQGFLQVGQRGM